MINPLYWVYVLRNPAGKFYTDVTADVAKRVEQHNAGVSKWTKKHGPWKQVWHKGPMTLSAARRLESWLKNQKGGDGFYSLTGLARLSGHAAGVVPPKGGGS